MAAIRTREIIEDTGSQRMAQLEQSVNELIDAFGDFVTTVKGAADVAAINTAATTAETALEANVVKIARSPTTPLQPTRPLKH